MKFNIIRKSLTYEWIDVKKKDGTTYRRRQRKKVPEIEHEKPFAEREKEFERSSLMAGLKDKLARSLKYNNNYYDTSTGRRIFVPEEYRDVVAKRINAKQNTATFVKDYLKDAGVENKVDFERHKKDNSIGKILVMDKMYNTYHEKIKKEFETLASNPEHYKQIITGSLGIIKKNNSSIAKMLGALKIVRNAISEHIDPTIEITYGGKTQEKSLNEILDRLENKTKENKNPYEDTGIEKIELKDLDNYEIDDFKQSKFKLNQAAHERIYQQIEKDLAKKLKKAKKK